MHLKRKTKRKSNPRMTQIPQRTEPKGRVVRLLRHFPGAREAWTVLATTATSESSGPLCFLCCLLFKFSSLPFVTPRRREPSARRLYRPCHIATSESSGPFVFFATFCSNSLSG